MVKATSLTKRVMAQTKVAPINRLPIGAKKENEFKKLVEDIVPPERIPTSIDQLGDAKSDCYSLSLNSAMELGIPIIGSMSGSYERKVVILEAAAHKPIKIKGTKYKYGWAVRINVTVKNIKGEVKAALPWLAASAELGLMEAQWGIYVTGLTGNKVRSAMVNPRELNVQSYVEATQSMAEIVAAVNHRSTKFIPALIGIEKSKQVLATEYLLGAAHAYALRQLASRKALERTLSDLGSDRDFVNDAIKELYKQFASIEDEKQKPSELDKVRAKDLLGKLG
jgi:hypothetical protein